MIGLYNNLNFILHSALPNNEMLEIIKKSDLVITEGQNTAYEAAALGTPVIHRPLAKQAISIGTVVKNIDNSLSTPESDKFTNFISSSSSLPSSSNSSSSSSSSSSLNEGIKWGDLKKEAVAIQLVIDAVPKHDTAIRHAIDKYTSLSKSKDHSQSESSPSSSSSSAENQKFLEMRNQQALIAEEEKRMIQERAQAERQSKTSTSQNTPAPPTPKPNESSFSNPKPPSPRNRG